MKAAAEADGIPPQLMTITSGYRGVAHQQRLWANALQRYGSPAAARRWVAPPGGSPHHTGRAVDLSLGLRNDSSNVPALRTTAAYKWLVCNAGRFGFTPYANEPWHWEYHPPESPLPSSRLGVAEPPGTLERGIVLAALRPFVGPDTTPTVQNALTILRVMSRYHNLPWRLAHVVLEHEGGVRLFRRHPDGVMQTTRSAREGTIPRIPRDLKLTLLGRPETDAIPDSDLNRLIQGEFPRRLAVQIATGVQELKTNLDLFNGYVALALIAYNAGPGWAAHAATQGRSKRRPPGITADQWENMCRLGAALYHQLPSEVRVTEGVWQCDANLPDWFSHFAVFDRQSGRQLVTYKYLRRFVGCIRQQKPSTPCTWANHGQGGRQPGSGPVVCRPTRWGALDKLYNPQRLSREYYVVAERELPAIPEDNLPLKAVGERLVKMPLMSGRAAP